MLATHPEQPEIILRYATDADSSALVALVNSAYRPSQGEEGWTYESAFVSGDRISPEQMAALLVHSQVLVAEHAGQLIASVEIVLEQDEATLGMLAVRPALQGSGLGGWLLQWAETVARQHGANRAKLTVAGAGLAVAGARQALVSFYQRRGYQLTGERVAYPVELGVGTPLYDELDLAVMRKALI